jgi:hypothetical protein
MSGTLTCPTPEQLRLLSSGLLPSAEAADVERHVEGCAACAGRLVEELARDPLFATLREPATRSLAVPEPPFVENLLAKLRALTPPPAPGGGAAPDVGAEACGYLTPPEAPGEIGRLGGYRVLAVLGRGGMGIVLRALDPQLGREVAIKVMRPDLAVNPAARERFLREARAAAGLKNDHVVTIHHVGEADVGGKAVPFLVMELLPGESLERRLKREKRLPPEEVTRLGREAALGLKAAHARGLVHRDVKPDNIWLEDVDGGPPRVKLLDFGLARLADGDSVTRPGSVLGTPAYMAPEQADGARVDARADLFSLGVVLYRVLTGTNPFDRGELMATLSALASVDPEPPNKARPDVPAALSGVVMRLLVKAPERRTASAEQLLRELTPLGARTAALPVAPPLATPVQPRRRRQRLGGRFLAYFLGGLGLFLVLYWWAVAAGVFESKRSDEASEGPEKKGPKAEDVFPRVTPAQVLAAIAADLRQAHEDDRPFYRYLTTVNLRPVTEEERPSEALSLIRSTMDEVNLHAGPGERRAFFGLLPLEDARHKDAQERCAFGVYRFDLRRIKAPDGPSWDEKDWADFLRRYPYGLDQTKAEDADVKRLATDIKQMTDGKLVHLRLDWFVWALPDNPSPLAFEPPQPGPRLPYRRQAGFGKTGDKLIEKYAKEPVGLKKAAVELGLDDPDRARELLRKDKELCQGCGLTQFLVGGFVDRTAWSSRDRGTSPFQDVAAALGLGAAAR